MSTSNSIEEMSHQNCAMIDWNKDRVMELIRYWKQWECLYNPSHNLYSNKSARLDALERITQQMQRNSPFITINAVKTKMNYLRSQYCREVHKHQLAQKNGTTSDDYYKNYPYWFDSLSFVKQYVRVRASATKRENNNFIFPDHFNISNEEISMNDFSIPLKRTKSCDGNQSSNLNSPSSTEQSSDQEAAVYLYKPDPDILELFQKQLEKVTSSQTSTNSDLEINSQQEVGTTSSITHPIINSNNNEYDQTFMNFIKLNLALITDATLKDELMDKITMLLLEYKGKQRKLES